MRKTILFALFSLPSLSCLAQDEHFENQFLEEMESFQEEDGAQFEVENLIDILNELKSHKIDLNTATEEDFEQLPFLHEGESRSLVRHRQMYGNYQTIFELKNIPELGMEKIQQLLPFVTIQEEERAITFKEMLNHRQSQIFLSADRFLQEKKGYEPDSGGTSKYAGPPIHYYAKYLFNADNIKASLVGEKDAGEAVWSQHGRGFDFISGSISFEGIRWVRQICIGDYKANFGQGLVVGSGSILGKTASVTNTYKGTQGLKRYASTGESDFFRGGGFTLGWKAIQLTLFASLKKCDATLNGEKISSFKSDGMHRTTLEISKKRNVTEEVVGGNLRFKRGNLTLGHTILQYRYSKELHPTEKRYTHFRLTDTNHHLNIGIDYKARWRHVSLFGESAIDAGGHFATMNGAAIFPLSRLEITIVQRHYSPAYQALYGKGFSENSRLENEQGYYISTRFSPFKRVTISAYADSFRFPWALSSTNIASHGYEYCLLANIKISKRCDETLKYKEKEKGNLKRTLRNTLNTQIGNWRVQTIAEINRSEDFTHAATYGWILSQSATGNIKPWHLSLAFRYAYFHATDYNNRIYIYEKDLPYTLSFPMHYGKGHRVAASLMWKQKEFLQLHFKAGWFIYTDGRESIGTGNEMMQGNVSTQVKAMLKVTI